MTTHLFSLGLVPVQAWVEEARRSRDLRAGSVILWWTMARVLHTLEEELSAEIVLPPSPEGGFERLAGKTLAEALHEPYGVPNRATGYCRAESAEKVEEVLRGLEQTAVGSAWSQVRACLFDPTRAQPPHPPDRRAFFAALSPHLEAYAKATGETGDCPFLLVWVATPVDERPTDTAGLREDLAKIDRLYTDVKRTRPIKAWGWGARVPKCNQCGRREAIGPRDTARVWRRWEQETWNQLEWVEEGYVVDREERLCPVCLARRLAAYPREEKAKRWRFSSTGEVAASLWIQAFEDADQELREVLGEIRKTALGREDLGRALYLSEAVLDEPKHEKLRRLRGELEARLRLVNQNRELALPTSPPSYLALLAFDGDWMGKQIREDPAEVPKGLVRFQEAAGQEVADAQGEAFYLAGDEGLVMAPVGTALGLALALRRRFEEAFEELATSPTLSVGLAFFEQSRPMRGAIQQARRALREAKAEDGKNSLGAFVETASGSRWGYVAPWGPAWERIEGAVRRVRRGELSASWAYDVERFLESLSSEDWRVLAAEPAALRAEVRRLFLRRLGEGRADREQGLEWWNELPGETWWEGEPARGPEPEQFHLIGFLSRQWEAGEEEVARKEGS